MTNIKHVNPKFYFIASFHSHIKDNSKSCSIIARLSYNELVALAGNFFTSYITVKTTDIEEALKHIQNPWTAVLIEYFDQPILLKQYGARLNCFVYSFKQEFLRAGIKILLLHYPFEPKLEPMNLKKTDYTIIAHQASTRNTLPDIAYMHMEEREFSCIGYHFIILKKGLIVYSRPIWSKGAHCWGYNDSFGICFASNLNNKHLNEEEIHSFNLLVNQLRRIYPVKHIIGHVIGQLEVIRKALVDDAMNSKANGNEFIYVEEIEVAKQVKKIIMQYASGLIHDAVRIREKLTDAMKSWLDIPDRTYLVGNTTAIKMKKLVEAVKDCPGKKYAYELYRI